MWTFITFLCAWVGIEEVDGREGKTKLKLIIEVLMQKSCLKITDCFSVFAAEMFVTLRSLMSSLSRVMVCPCSCQVTCLPVTSWSLVNIGCGVSLQIPDPDLEVCMSLSSTLMSFLSNLPYISIHFLATNSPQWLYYAEHCTQRERIFNEFVWTNG